MVGTEEVVMVVVSRLAFFVVPYGFYTSVIRLNTVVTMINSTLFNFLVASRPNYKISVHHATVPSDCCIVFVSYSDWGYGGGYHEGWGYGGGGGYGGGFDRSYNGFGGGYGPPRGGPRGGVSTATSPYLIEPPPAYCG